MVHICNSYFTLRHLESGTVQGLFASFKRAVEYMNMDDWRTKLIGFGCDGNNANMAAGGLRGLLEVNCHGLWFSDALLTVWSSPKRMP